MFGSLEEGVTVNREGLLGARTASVKYGDGIKALVGSAPPASAGK